MSVGLGKPPPRSFYQQEQTTVNNQDLFADAELSAAFEKSPNEEATETAKAIAKAMQLPAHLVQSSADAIDEALKEAKENLMQLTPANYHSPEANREYMSNSQFGDWVECAAKTYAIQEGKYVEEKKMLFVAGQYAHADILEPEKMDEFRKQNPGIKKPLDWTLKQLKEMAANHDPVIDLKGAGSSKDKVVERMAEYGFTPPEPELVWTTDFKWLEGTLEGFKSQEAFMELIARGDHETIITFPLGTFGGKPVMWKAMLDNIRIEDNQFDDLKFMRDFESRWCDDRKGRVGWHELHYYDRQMAVYREAAKFQFGGDWRPNILAASKQEPPDFAWLQFRDITLLDDRINEVTEQIEQVMAWKLGEQEAPRCGKSSCLYCRSTKKVTIPHSPKRTY